jgi:hypothetical protein
VIRRDLFRQIVRKRHYADGNRDLVKSNRMYETVRIRTNTSAFAGHGVRQIACDVTRELRRECARTARRKRTERMPCAVVRAQHNGKAPLGAEYQ